jgi:hypothetical protein
MGIAAFWSLFPLNQPKSPLLQNEHSLKRKEKIENISYIATVSSLKNNLSCDRILL